MSRRKKQRHKDSITPPKGNHRVSVAAVSILAVVIVVALAVWWRAPQRTAEPPATRARPEATDPTTPAATAPSTAPVATAAKVAPPADFQKLKGKWRRPDGGYVLEIKSAADSGQLDATYANPRPIHVAKAAASREGQAIKVFVELRDVNYPGSTYNLTYDPQRDLLEGIYYQAALQQQFEVVFTRID